MEDLLEPHLSEVVIDPIELRLVDRLVERFGELVCRLEVVAERLLDDDAAGCGQAGVRQVLHDRPEQERRDLEVEDRGLRLSDRLRDAVVGRRVREVPVDVREPACEAIEHLRIDLLACAFDALAGMDAELVDRPVVHGDAHDRTVE